MSKVFLVVGARGTGKTTFSKNMLSKVHPKARLVYDPYGDYKELYPHPIITLEEFTELTTRVSNALILYDEATAYISYKGSNEEIRESLVRARHSGNSVVFCFHSFRAIPRYVYDLADYVVIHKTNDTPKLIEQKFESEELMKAFVRIKNSEWIYNIKNGKRVLDPSGNPQRRSKFEIFDIYGIVDENEA